MFLDKKTLLKIWLNPGLNLTIFRGTGPGVISFSVIKEIRNVKRNAKEQENKSRVLAKKSIRHVLEKLSLVRRAGEVV